MSDQYLTVGTTISLQSVIWSNRRPCCAQRPQLRFSNGVARMSKEPGRFFPRPPTVCTLAKEQTCFHSFKVFAARFSSFAHPLPARGRASAGCTPGAASISLVVRPGKALWPCSSSGEKLRLYLGSSDLRIVCGRRRNCQSANSASRQDNATWGALIRFGFACCASSGGRERHRANKSGPASGAAR